MSFASTQPVNDTAVGFFLEGPAIVMSFLGFFLALLLFGVLGVFLPEQDYALSW